MGFPNSKVMKASVVLPLLGKGQTKLRKRDWVMAHFYIISNPKNKVKH